MGTHHSSPSRLLDSPSQEKLSDYLAAHPGLIGSHVIERFRSEGAAEGNLPFLFKVLAIEKALSIQTHPDKEMAQRLHKERPDVYKGTSRNNVFSHYTLKRVHPPSPCVDANHKPEMALALTPFQAMCGFLPLPRIADYIVDTSEFAALVPQAIQEQFLSLASSDNPTGPAQKKALKDVFTAVMTAEESIFKPELEKLVARYGSGDAKVSEKEVVDLVLRLNSQFPGDIGVFCAFMLNHLVLRPGEAIFLAAGEPHAYVSGGECERNAVLIVGFNLTMHPVLDIVECMATSDNVIRAGLTPKLRDVPNLVAGLTYNSAHASKHLVEPGAFDSATHSTLYDPPIPEFSVVRASIPPGETEVHPPIDGPSIAIVTAGKGSIAWGSNEKLELSEGDVFFVGAGHEVRLAAGGEGELIIHRAFVEAK